MKALSNPEAKRFFVTYFSAPTLKKGYPPDVMFTFFINFVDNLTGIKIPETLENQKEFVTLMDQDGSLQADFGEINEFFDKYVDIGSKKFNLHMTAGLAASADASVVPAKSEQKFPSKKVTLTVLNDFAEEEASERR